MVTNGLFPDYLGGYFNNLIGAMKAGLPKIRDRDGATVPHPISRRCRSTSLASRSISQPPTS